MGACDVGQTGGVDFGGISGAFLGFFIGLKKWLINLNWHLLECMGLILMGTKGYYGMSHLVCVVGGIFLSV